MKKLIRNKKGQSLVETMLVLFVILGMNIPTFIILNQVYGFMDRIYGFFS